MRATKPYAAALTIVLVMTGLASGDPSARPGWGANPYFDIAGTGVTFRVWAPNATNVQVAGQFNGWVPSPSLGQESNGAWSVDIAGAAAGQQYKFVINGNLYRKDPRGRMVVNSSDNSIIYDPASFAWPTNEFSMPATNEIVMYELHAGTFRDVNPYDGLPSQLPDLIGALDHLTNLGINCVQLMPVWEFPLNHSWGYNPSDPFAVENDGYGGPDGLKQFVAACHQRGLAVLLDVVHNHYGPGDLDLWQFDGPGNPYFYAATGICCTTWGPRPDYSSQGVRDFIADNCRMWLDEYRVDGFRWDSPMNIASWGGTNPIPEGASLVDEINAMIHSNFPGRVSIGEDAGQFASFDSEWHAGFHDSIVGELAATNDADRDVHEVAYQVATGPGFRRVIYTENHDKAGTLNGGKRVPVAVDPSAPTGLKAHKLSAMGAVLTLTAPGVPMLFMGQEMLEESAFSDTNPLDWKKSRARFRVVQMYRDLVRMRRGLDGGTAGLRGTNVDVYHVNSGAKVMAYHRWTNGGTNDQAVVVMNLSSNTWINYNLSFPTNGRWYAHFNSDWPLYMTNASNVGAASVVATGATRTANISIAPYASLILSRATPPLRDADGDAIHDAWEIQHGLDPTNAADATLNVDGDLLNNLQEYERESDPNAFDLFTAYSNMTFAGTMNGWNAAARNMKAQTNYAWSHVAPFDEPGGIRFRFTADEHWQDSWGDDDQGDFVATLGGVADGIGDMVVSNALSSVCRVSFNETNRAYDVAILEYADADGDGMHDAWELFHGLSPAQSLDAAGNPDGDGYSNLQEFQRGLDPAAWNSKTSAASRVSVAGTFNGWNAAASNLVLVADYTWEWITTFTNTPAAGFKFTADGSWAMNWGDANPGSVAAPINGLGETFGSDITVAGALDGVYRFRFNELTAEYDVRPLFQSDHHAMTLTGNFNGWEPGLNNMSLVSNHLWRSVITYAGAPGAEFKFAANSGWSSNWGENGQTNFGAPLAGAGITNAGNITLNGPLHGDYTFHFRDTDSMYRVDFTPQRLFTNITIAGTFNAWNTSNNLMRLVDNHTWQFETNLFFASNTAFKFALDGNWLTNWGELNASAVALPLNGTSVAYAGNINADGALAGRHRFRFNDESLAYSLDKVVDPDADVDGLPDWWEAQFGSMQPGQDSDADGIDNISEFRADTNPNDAASELSVVSIKPALVTWKGGQFATQYVDCADSVAGPWMCLATNLPPTSVTNQLPAGATNVARFYRIRAAPAL